MYYKILKRFCTVFIAMLIVLSAFGVAADQAETTVQILFTHDLHSRVEAETVSSKSTGGFARIMTLINKKKSEDTTTVLVDGGDFSMGTLYQTLYETDAAELTLLGYMGYDAVTLGNHEFDYRSEGIANMLNSAVEKGRNDSELTLPRLVISNIDWEKNNSKDNRLVKSALDNYGASEYTVIERGGVRIGIFGLFGEDAEDCAPESGIDFDDIAQSAKKTVKKLKNENVDMIICLSHSGTDKDEDESEDGLLAQKVPDIDVIISGHTHTKLKEPLQYGDTYIVSAGDYGRYLGELDMVRKGDGRWEMENYKLNSTKESVAEDGYILSKLENYRRLIDEKYLSRFGFTCDQVLAVNNIEFTSIGDLGDVLEEDTLGNIIADSYRYAVKQAEGDSYDEVALAVTAAGTIRDSIKKGEITVWDAFNINSLGIGADRVAGYPLVSVYLTGKELKTVAEIDVSVSSVMSAAQIYPSGVKWIYNPNRIILNKVTDVKLVDESGNETDLQDGKLYRVVGGLYTAQMLGAVEEASLGILKITPKDRYGNPITNFEEHIVHDKNGNEVKEWYAFASYLESFEKNSDGISEIPARYAETEGRKTAVNSKNIVDILKNPNKIAIIVYALVLFVVLVIIFVVVLIVRRNKQRKQEND